MRYGRPGSDAHALRQTRLQVAASNPGMFGYTGTAGAVAKIVRREGPRALFDGCLSRVLLLTPRLSIAILFSLAPEGRC